MPFTRREFLQGIGLAAGGLGVIAPGYEDLVPYIDQPNEMTPGAPVFYATTCRECPAGCGMLAKCRESRVIKCEGNPLNPINLGTLCARGQAAPQGLYDPDRVRQPMMRAANRLVPTGWDEGLRSVGEALSNTRKVAIISDLQTGSLESLMRAWLNSLGAQRLLAYEPISYVALKEACGGIVPAFGIEQCDYLISFGADFLETWISPVQFAREFAEMRQVRNGKRAGFVYVGPRVSATAAKADIRILVPPGAESEIAAAIADAIWGAGSLAKETEQRYGIELGTIRHVATSLSRAKSPLVLPGGKVSSAKAAMYLNGRLGSMRVDPGTPHALTHASGISEMNELVESMERGEIEALIVLNANPAFSLPDAARFTEALKRVRTVVSLSSFMDETTALAGWVVPSNTPLESWGDYAPYPSRITGLMQPVMGTLFDTRQAGDILIQLAQAAGVDPAKAFEARTFYEYLRRRRGFPATGPEAVSPEWERLLQTGGVYLKPRLAKRAPFRPVDTLDVSGFGVSEDTELPANPKSRNIELHVFPHIYYYDGRGANKRWLQEMPEPVTNAVWGTWAEMHPDTAKALGVETDDIIQIWHGDSKIEIGAYVWEGVAPGIIALPIGEGHKEYGRYAKGVGVNVWPLSGNGKIRVRPTGRSRWVTRIGGSTDQHGRRIVQTVSLDEPFKREREIDMPLPEGYGPNDFTKSHSYPLHRWAMVIDLDRCIGCHACSTACHAENNIATVGPEGIYRRREMSWLRIDHYIDWRETSAPILFQPMLCQHCDCAPCETVCPVYAAAHSDEGLNMQVYNRCVGTRYCMNNDPYKVRRFNWFGFKWPYPLDYQLNPDVTVRCRGVMEKCTFCIQRIRLAEIVAKRECRKLKDGEVVPACAQTCPTGVFTFGDLMDPESRVSKLFRTDPRAYQVLGELNTKPGIVYLKPILAASPAEPGSITKARKRENAKGNPQFRDFPISCFRDEGGPS